MGKNSKISHRVFNVIGCILCVILVPILIVNCTMIVKSFIHKDETPSFLNMTPLIVLTGSMEPVIYSGDLVITTGLDAEEVKVGDVISFYDPVGNGTSIVTHRVTEIIRNEDGTLAFTTKGDNNNTQDKEPVPQKNLIGKYRVRFAGLGSVAMFMQTTPGFLLCVLLPLVLLIGYDMIKRRKFEQAHTEDTDALMAELEALRAEKAKAEQKDAADENPNEGSNP